MYHERRTTANGTPLPYGDRSPIAQLIKQEGAAHLLAVGQRPTPAMLHLLASIAAQMAGGAR